MRRPGSGIGNTAPRHGLRPDTVLRRVVDVIIASIVLVAVSPLLLVVGLAVRVTTRGPVLYKQVRAGKSGKPFTIFKFRSMVCNADSSGPRVTTGPIHGLPGSGP